MATNADNLETRIATLTANIAALLVEKPNYAAAGRSWEWNQHYESMNRQLDQLVGLRPRVDGCWEVRSRGVT